jgi:ribokinase
MTRLSVVCFGALNVDLIFRVTSQLLENLGYKPGHEYLGTKDQLEKLLSTLHKQGRLCAKSGGGSAANTAVALQRLGITTGYIGRVGTDPDGEFLISSLEEVDKGGIRRAGRTGLALSLIPDDKKDRTLVVFPNSNDDLTFDEIDLSYTESVQVVHLTSFFGSPPFEAQKELVGRLPPNTLVSLDPGMPYAFRGLKALEPLLSKAFILFIQEKEVEILTRKNHLQGGKQLLDMGPKIVACKMGSVGSVVFTHEGNFLLPSLNVSVIDPTGAGDVYAAGFLASILRGKSLHECAEFATEVASISITGFGRSCYPRAAGL